VLNETLQLPPSVLCAGGPNRTFNDADALRNVGYRDAPAGRILTASGHTAKQYTPLTNQNTQSISRNDWLCSDSVRYHKADSDSAVKAPLHTLQIHLHDASQDTTRVRWRYHRGWRQIAPGTAVIVPFVTNPRFSTPNVRRRVAFAYIMIDATIGSDLNAGT
jgi:hypothetical protein